MSLRPSRCKRCHASGNDVPISRNGLCYPCGEEAVIGNIRALQNQNGAAYDRWLMGCAQSAATRFAAMDDASQSD